VTGVVREAAPAKLNLALHVRRRRPDGYHDLETLFAFARDGDTVTVAIAEAPSFTVTGPFADALRPSSPSPLRGEGRGEGQEPRRERRLAETPSPHQHRVNDAPHRSVHAGGMDDPMLLSPEGRGSASLDNLVTRAEAAFRAAFGIDRPHALALDKHLPVASGIGGGSADAAATLRALARLHGIDPDEPRLYTIAASLGADVPACLLGRAAFGRGRGDDLEPIEGLGDCPALLVNPGVAVPTGPVFAGWDGVDRGPIAPGATLDRARVGRNDLQPPAEAIAPVIADAVALLAAQPGALLARMSGSGATCFALFADLPARDAAEAAVAGRHPDWWRLATSVA
jgi:4-diphosphocytidyl-2-C-methyl-D-erythritol kinase